MKTLLKIVGIIFTIISYICAVCTCITAAKVWLSGKNYLDFGEHCAKFLD